MSPLLRAAAAAARRGLARMPSTATTTTMHGRRTMASSSSAGTETMEGTWLFRLGLFWGGLNLISSDVESKMRRIAAQVHVEEMNSIRKEMKALQASNHELRALLKRRRTQTQG